ncbi:GNAT family N-acetyltransferase [Pseudoxanthomonas beigongshangi]
MIAYALRSETPVDPPAIRLLITEAFTGAEHASGTEAAIVDALRARGELTLSLLAEQEGRVIGHVAFSPVGIADGASGWYGLGPVAVAPDRQGAGVGAALIEAGLARLRQAGAGGCVVLGDPGYYARFGFANDADLRYEGAPAEYFMALTFDGSRPHGAVTYSVAFEATETARD